METAIPVPMAAKSIGAESVRMRRTVFCTIGRNIESKIS